jgi:uncharacterized membrane protein YbaN (DUF454 family)
LRSLFFIIGALATLLGFIGIIVPVLPTTPFLLVAAWAFSRSSPRFEAWLMEHRLFGPPLRSWRDERAISTRAKAAAVIMMSASFLTLVLTGVMPTIALVVLGLIMAACAVYIVTRNVPASAGSPVAGAGSPVASAPASVTPAENIRRD